LCNWTTRLGAAKGERSLATPKAKASDIARSLRERIAAAEWSTTSALPNERALSAEYGVARNTMRRAISTLVEAGLVSRHVGRGTIIHAERNDSPDDLAPIVRKLSGTSPLDIMNMRILIEPAAAAAAAANANADEIAGIAAAHRAASAETEMEPFQLWDVAFHERIFAATRNELLRNLSEILAVMRTRGSMVEVRRRGFSEVRRQEYCRQHGAILDAIAARDSEAAAAAMRAHLVAQSGNLFGGALN
jgi:DNA-binding FadR family transcriptional regulator